MVLAAWGGNIVFLRQTRARRLSCKSNHRCELTANFSNPFLAALPNPTKPNQTFEFNNFKPPLLPADRCFPSFQTFAQVQRKTLPLLSQKRGSLSLKGTVFW